MTRHPFALWSAAPVSRLRILLLSALCMLHAPAPAAGEDSVTALPAPVVDLAVADAGRSLVLQLQGQKGLAVYDTRTQKLSTIALPSADFTFGAGGDTAVVFLKETNEIRSFNLQTLAQIKAKEFADPVILMRIVMGHSRRDLAFVRIARGTDSLSQTTNQFLDVSTLTLQPPRDTQLRLGRNSSYRDNAHYRANGDMSRMTEWATSHSPCGIYLYTRTGDGYQMQGNHDSAGHLAMGDDGRIYTGLGSVMDLALKQEGPFPAPIGPVGKVPGSSLFPGIGGQFFLGLQSDGTLTLYPSGETTALCPLDPFPDWTPPRSFDPKRPQPPSTMDDWLKGTLTLDKRITFAPAAGHLVFLPPASDRLIQRQFDLTAAFEKSGRDYLQVLSTPPVNAKAGAQWEYRLTTLAKHSPLKFQLEKSPEGMVLSPEGTLTWKIPGGIQGTAPVTVTITDSKAQVIRHTFTITFE